MTSIGCLGMASIGCARDDAAQQRSPATKLAALAYLHNNRLVTKGEPAVLVLGPALGDRQVPLLELAGDGTGLSLAHDDPVNRADRSNLGGGADEEDLVGDVEHLAGHG